MTDKFFYILVPASNELDLLRRILLNQKEACLETKHIKKLSGLFQAVLKRKNLDRLNTSRQIFIKAYKEVYNTDIENLRPVLKRINGLIERILNKSSVGNQTIQNLQELCHALYSGIRLERIVFV